MARGKNTDVSESQRVPESASGNLARKATAEPTHLEPRAGQVAYRPQVDGQSKVAGIFSRLMRALVWAITLSLVCIGLLRVFYHDGTLWLVCLNAFSRYIYLPAYACLAWAVWKRRWYLATANMLVVALHVALIAPDFMRDSRFDSATSSVATAPAAQQSIRIFFANVHATSTNYQGLLDEIAAANPDVVLLVEFSWSWRNALLNSPFLKAYPYGDGIKHQRLGTVNIFSRIPLIKNEQDWVAGRGLQKIEIPVGGKTLRIVGLHAPRPQRRQGDDYDGFWKGAIPKILSDPGPLVVVGDFNVTQYSSVYKQLTATRLRSAHEDRGRGYANSWPNGQFWLPPLIRIDQALLSPDVECVDIREGEGHGSDHMPLSLDVKIRPDA